jgi:RND family efflux transporter MFP subunit
MTLRAPTEGIVTLFPNWRVSMGGGIPPDFKEGDRAWPGAVIAEIPDLSSIRFEARIDETDRGRLKNNETALVRVDALPDREFTARIRDISTLAKIDFSGGWPPIKNFAIRIDIDNTDPRIRPGMSATCRVPVNRMPDSIVVPAESVFQKDGESVVYVPNGKQFEQRKIQVGRRNATSVQIVSGVQPGERVALKDPTEVSTSK